MPDDVSVHQKVHLNVHLPQRSAGPSGDATDGTTWHRRLPPRGLRRKGSRRLFLHCRDGYWFFQRRWPKPLDSSSCRSEGRARAPQRACARRLAQALALQTGAYFESLIRRNISGSLSTGSDATPRGFESACSDRPGKGRAGSVVHVAIKGKLPSSRDLRDEGEKLRLGGIKAA